MKILVTNDDGIDADGIRVLEYGLQRLGHETTVVAPLTNCSGQSGAITLEKSLTVVEHGDRHWAVGGSPADCVRVARAFLQFRPDLVCSGVNHGYNLGFDSYASGTVGAARMASMRGLPAVAFSAPPMVSWEHVTDLLERHGRAIIAETLAHATHTVISVNFPPRGGERMVYANLSDSAFVDEMQWAEFKDGRHRVKLTSTSTSPARYEPDTDVEAVRHQNTALTHLPLVPMSATTSSAVVKAR